MSPLIPGTRSYTDPISKGEEIWLEGESVGKIKEWLRCRVRGEKEEIGTMNVVPVDIQRCIQELRNSFVAKIQGLLKRTDDDCLYIPTSTGELSHEKTKASGSRMTNMYLAWGDGVIDSIQDMEHISSHDSVHVMKGHKKEVPPPILNHKPTAAEVGENSYKDLNSLPPRERIVKIEQGLLLFEQKLLDKLKQLGLKRPGLPLAIQNPFTFIRENSRNPIKYYGDAAQAADEHGIPAAAALFAMPEPFYFSYAFKEDIDRNDGVMAYAPLLRSVIMNAYRSPELILDNCIFMHEMVHCMHAAHQRKRDMEKHFSFQLSRSGDTDKKVVIQEEYDAYAVELEALNIALDNALLSKVESGGANPEEIAERLRVTEQQKITVQMLCMLANVYFKDSSIGKYSPEYTDLVNKIVMFDGMDLYSPDYQLLARSKDHF